MVNTKTSSFDIMEVDDKFFEIFKIKEDERENIIFFRYNNEDNKFHNMLLGLSDVVIEEGENDSLELKMTYYVDDNSFNSDEEKNEFDKLVSEELGGELVDYLTNMVENEEPFIEE